MKRIIYVLTLFIISPLGGLNAQSIVKSIMNTEPDSCFLSIHKVVTKEMAKPFEEPYEQELIALKLSNRDGKTLLKRASRKSSYQDSRALLTHYNVMFSFYKNNTICSTVQLSTLTGNIEIRNPDTQEEFYSKISNKFGRYLIDVFKAYEVFEMISPSNRKALNEKLQE